MHLQCSAYRYRCRQWLYFGAVGSRFIPYPNALSTSDCSISAVGCRYRLLIVSGVSPSRAATEVSSNLFKRFRFPILFRCIRRSGPGPLWRPSKGMIPEPANHNRPCVDKNHPISDQMSNFQKSGGVEIGNPCMYDGHGRHRRNSLCTIQTQILPG